MTDVNKPNTNNTPTEEEILDEMGPDEISPESEVGTIDTDSMNDEEEEDELDENPAETENTK